MTGNIKSTGIGLRTGELEILENIAEVCEVAGRKGKDRLGKER